MSFPEDSDYHSQLTPDAFVLYPSTARLLAMTLTCVVFLLIAIPLWNDGHLKYKAAAVADVIFCGLAVVFFISKLMRRVPSLM